MKKGVFLYIWICLLQMFFLVSLSSQNLTQSYLDSLSYEELLTEFNEFSGDSINQESIARAYLNRARNENDTIKMARGYDRLARIFHMEKNISYADSIIILTNKLNHQTYPALAYLIKGFEYHVNNDIINSTENFFKAYDLSIERNNVPQQIFVLHLLIYNKALWGDKHKALELQHERHSLVISPNYVESLQASTRTGANIDINQLLINDLVLSYGNYFFCHLQLNHLDSAQYYLNKCKTQVEKYNWVGKAKHKFFLQEAKVELEYKKKNFTKSKIIANKILKLNQDSISLSSKINLYYLIGVSNLKKKNYKEGFKNLIIADSLYEFNELQIQPKHREIFQTLNEYYSKNSDQINQINVLNKLILIDSISKSYYQHFEPRMTENFDTPRLLAKKEILISQLEQKNKKTKTINWLIIIFLIFSLLLLGYYIQRQQLYKRRFDKLMINSDTKTTNGSNRYAHELSPEVITSILNKLEAFENSKEFLNHEITLQSLAKYFKTNANYLSRVTNLKIGKNFSQYINDLRIEYSMKRILSEKKIRNYTIKAIAEECGYKNAESFSKAFYKRNGIYPSYYIKKLNKTDPVT